MSRYQALIQQSDIAEFEFHGYSTRLRVFHRKEHREKKIHNSLLVMVESPVHITKFEDNSSFNTPS